jgi:hypothetical protein
MDEHPMSAYRRALQVLERSGDAELFEAYQRYLTRLETILTAEEQALYCTFQQRTQGGVQPEEQTIADKVAADGEALQLYDRYLTLLSSRQSASGAQSVERRTPSGLSVK